MQYNAVLTVDHQVSPHEAERWVDDLVELHPAVSDRDVTITITLAHGGSFVDAVLRLTDALAQVVRVAHWESLEVLPTATYDARNGVTDV